MNNEIRTKLKELKEGFLDGKMESKYEAVWLVNIIVIVIIYLLFLTISVIIYFTNLKVFSFIIFSLSTVDLINSLLNKEGFSATIALSTKIVFKLFGKYGRVITKSDWKQIKKYSYLRYINMVSKRRYEYLSLISWEMALLLEEAELMYCIAETDCGAIAHSVIVKNNCVYDPLYVLQFDYNEYVKMHDVEIYKKFSYEEYDDSEFPVKSLEDFSKWCIEKCNIYGEIQMM